MADDLTERDFAYGRRTDRNYYSTRFTQRGEDVRMFYKVFDGDTGLQFAEVENEIVLQTRMRPRYEVKAAVLEDGRHIRNLIIQKFTAKEGWCEKLAFNFNASETQALLRFIAGMKTISFENENKSYLTDEALVEIVLNKSNAQQVFRKHEDLILEFIQNEDMKADVVAVAYRRKQLERFEELMVDPATDEAAWQVFFEQNTWIFGYGLSYRFMTELDRKALQQFTTGFDLSGSGKQADGFMKTRGRISSTCFVEIKRHDTQLLVGVGDSPGSWAPSAKLSAAVAQVQKTVYSAAESLKEVMNPREDDGTDTGEVLFNVEPRACLVVGNLSEFFKEGRLNRPKYQSFELFRRNTWRPEILTFDELLERARFIVDSRQGEAPKLLNEERPKARGYGKEDLDEDIPF